MPSILCINGPFTYYRFRAAICNGPTVIPTLKLNMNNNTVLYNFILYYPTYGLSASITRHCAVGQAIYHFNIMQVAGRKITSTTTVYHVKKPRKKGEL